MKFNYGRDHGDGESASETESGSDSSAGEYSRRWSNAVVGPNDMRTCLIKTPLRLLVKTTAEIMLLGESVQSASKATFRVVSKSRDVHSEET